MLAFVETSLFSRLVVEYLSDEEYVELQGKPIQDPEAGMVIRGSGGVRQFRWAAPLNILWSIRYLLTHENFHITL